MLYSAATSCWSHLASVGIERGFHVLANLFQVGAVGLGPLRFRLQQVVADVGARNVNIGPDVVQNMILRKIAAPDLIVAAAELLQDAQGIDSGQSHDRQQPAKTNGQCDA